MLFSQYLPFDSKFWHGCNYAGLVSGAVEIRDKNPISLTSNIWLRFRRYAGIGFLVAVGYMDPGNWATDIEAGSRFGYSLLWVVLSSCFVAMILQTLCVRLGMVSGKDLAQLCRIHFPPRYCKMLWGLAQISILACDFAEVLGTALALKFLFGLPLQAGILLTAFDTLVIFGMQRAGVWRVETIVAIMVCVIAIAFSIELAISPPDLWQLVKGVVPDTLLFSDPKARLVAIGIIGATVMPHNLYLHSAAVSSRKLFPGAGVKRDAIRLLTWDTVATLSLALLVNAAILILAASVFHSAGHNNVADIADAYKMLATLLGTSLASIVFGLALFVSGQSSTITGTMAGQVILQGFMELKIPGWQQRLFTRLITVMPAWLVIMWNGEGCLGELLVYSQVVLSMQLPFAMAPLIWFNTRRDIMGEWQLSPVWRCLCWVIFVTITIANIYLVYTIFQQSA